MKISDGMASPLGPVSLSKDAKTREIDSDINLDRQSMINIDSETHATGQSLYIDDVPVPEGTLYGYVFYGATAHAKILSLDVKKAEEQAGVYKVFTAKDIPGVNQIGSAVEDEPLFAEDEIHFWGQPLALVVAENDRIAKKASRLIEYRIKELTPITDPRTAAKKNQLLIPPVTFARGDVDAAFAQCVTVVEGQAESGGQEHLYLEPQGALAVLTEHGGIHITSSTQGPTAVQRTTAKVLGIPMHKVEVEVRRLGGGFGGKEDQATPWAVMAALAVSQLKRPVKLVLHRIDDMRMTGKRHPYTSDFKIGLNREGRILAYQVSFYQNGGAAADLSPAVLARSLLHACNSYYIPHVKAVGYSCKTNLPPNTAFRGFGGPQGMFVIEAAIHKAAERLGLDPAELQKKNLLQEGEKFHYGQPAKACQARACWAQAEERFQPQLIRQRLAKFNQENSLYKKGMAFMPVCFGISFTKTPMNQASALVHIYQDGSVSVSTAAVEMGQGVNTKILQVVASVLGIRQERIKILSTNTSRVANTSPTAASSGADLNGKAVEKACLLLRGRLLDFARDVLQAKSRDVVELSQEKVYLEGRASALHWQSLIAEAYLKRVSLSAQEHYATPHLFFDLQKAQGSPFAYHVYGTSVTEVTVDCLRGRYVVDRVSIVHDFGECLNWKIDLGQVEGALMQGIGWMTLEELLFNEQGRPLTDTLSAYKVPDIYSAPKEVEVHALQDAHNPMGVFNSKAIGEPPLMYGIGTFFAIRDAIRAFSPAKDLPLVAPLTPERVLTHLYETAL